jgi:hypothetical protein
MLVDELLSYIFEHNTHSLAAQFALWVGSSIRFRGFAERYRDKIRKKVRGIRETEGLKDLEFELEVAYLLLEERRFTVEYEKGGVGKQRGPDLSVTFKTHLLFNVEVKRIRLSVLDRRVEQPEYSRIASTICQKIGQLPAGMINLVAITSDTELYGGSDVSTALAGLRARAGRKDDDFFVRRGFSGAADFLKQYQRLSAVLFCNHLGPGNGAQSLLCANSIARHRLPDDLRNALRRLGTTE